MIFQKLFQISRMWNKRILNIPVSYFERNVMSLSLRRLCVIFFSQNGNVLYILVKSLRLNVWMTIQIFSHNITTVLISSIIYRKATFHFIVFQFSDKILQNYYYLHVSFLLFDLLWVTFSSIPWVFRKIERLFLRN